MPTPKGYSSLRTNRAWLPKFSTVHHLISAPMLYRLKGWSHQKPVVDCPQGFVSRTTQRNQQQREQSRNQTYQTAILQFGIEQPYQHRGWNCP